MIRLIRLVSVWILVSLFTIGICTAQKKSVNTRKLRVVTEKKLARHQNAPVVLGLSIYSDRTGKYCRMDIAADRVRARYQLILAFKILAETVPESQPPITKFYVGLHPDSGGQLPEFWVSNAEKTRDCFIRSSLEINSWENQFLYQIVL